MAAAESDVKADTARPERSASPAPAPAAAPAAKAKAKAAPVPRKAPPPLCDRFCAFLVCLFFGVLLLGFLALAELDMWPGSLIRPYIWGPSPAITSKDWDEKTVGRTVFLKFYMPKCPHCKKIAPKWEKLTAENANHDFLRVGEVDCSRKGRTLCQKFGIASYPTLKYGDPNDLQDYTGGRGFSDLSKFASELGPTCGPEHLQVCSEEQKKKIKEYQAMDAARRQVEILELEAEEEKIDAEFRAYVDALSNEAKVAGTKKEEGIMAVMKGGLNTLRAIAAHEAVLSKSEDSKKDDKTEKGDTAGKAEL